MISLKRRKLTNVNFLVSPKMDGTEKKTHNPKLFPSVTDAYSWFHGVFFGKRKFSLRLAKKLYAQNLGLTKLVSDVTRKVKHRPESPHHFHEEFLNLDTSRDAGCGPDYTYRTQGNFGGNSLPAM